MYAKSRVSLNSNIKLNSQLPINEIQVRSYSYKKNYHRRIDSQNEKFLNLTAYSSLYTNRYSYASRSKTSAK